MEISDVIYYGHNSVIKDTLSCGKFLQIAIISDKYDGFNFLAVAIMIWLNFAVAASTVI
jgi:hypothetical protein